MVTLPPIGELVAKATSVARTAPLSVFTVTPFRSSSALSTAVLANRRTPFWFSTRARPARYFKGWKRAWSGNRNERTRLLACRGVGSRTSVTGTPALAQAARPASNSEAGGAGGGKKKHL